jgi:hypothetical protein|tara:strand:- start:57 stop:695 length:639 start_codon:yes stop_codon:yes gene_type:complete
MDSHFVYEIKDNLPKNICDAIIKKFESDKDNHVIGKLGGGDPSDTYVNKNWKDSTELNLKMSHWEKALGKLEFFLKRGMDEYMKEVYKYIGKQCGAEDNDFAMHYSLGTNYITDICSIQRIKKDRHYRWHHDYMPEQPTRTLTFMWYLNTLEPDEGGNTGFIHGRRVRPEAGKLIIFPSTWTCLHTGELIKADAKYLIVGGIHRPDELYKGE